MIVGQIAQSTDRSLCDVCVAPAITYHVKQALEQAQDASCVVKQYTVDKIGTIGTISSMYLKSASGKDCLRVSPVEGSKVEDYSSAEGNYLKVWIS